MSDPNHVQCWERWHSDHFSELSPWRDSFFEGLLAETEHLASGGARHEFDLTYAAWKCAQTRRRNSGACPEPGYVVRAARNEWRDERRGRARHARRLLRHAVHIGLVGAKRNSRPMESARAGTAGSETPLLVDEVADARARMPADLRSVADALIANTSRRVGRQGCWTNDHQAALDAYGPTMSRQTRSRWLARDKCRIATFLSGACASLSEASD